MKLRYRLAMPLVALSLALAFSPALATKTTPIPTALPGGPSSITGSSAFCQLGQTGASGTAIWFYAVDDYYYTFIDPATCGCPAGLTNLTANWMLFYTEACTMDLQVWVVKAIDSGGGCYIPDAGGDPPDPTAAETLCGPTAIVSQPGAGIFTHSVALPPCDCLANGQPAFILFKIVGPGNCPVADGVLNSPQIVFDDSPDPCVSYNGFLGGAPAEMTTTFGFPGNVTMWVDADCCQPTPTLPGTWGNLKTLYR